MPTLLAIMLLPLVQNSPLLPAIIWSNVQFLPRDAMRKRGLRYHSVSICLSVCLSVTFVNYIQTARDIVKLLSRPGSPIILVFDPKRRCPIPRGTSSVGTENTRGWKKFAIFY